MRNQPTPRINSTPEAVYAAASQLDGHAVEITAWNHGRLQLDFGPCSLSLSAAAMIELITHLHRAMDSIVESLEAQGDEQEADHA